MLEGYEKHLLTEYLSAKWESFVAFAKSRGMTENDCKNIITGLEK